MLGTKKYIWGGYINTKIITRNKTLVIQKYIKLIVRNQIDESKSYQNYKYRK
jgi:hypothetical protein